MEFFRYEFYCYSCGARFLIWGNQDGELIIVWSLCPDCSKKEKEGKNEKEELSQGSLLDDNLSPL